MCYLQRCLASGGGAGGGRLKGLILRSQLILLLKHKAFTDEPDSLSRRNPTLSDLLKLEHFRDAIRGQPCVVRSPRISHARENVSLAILKFM